MNLESKARINSLISAANATTGKADTDLTSAVGALIAGFGQGGGGGVSGLYAAKITPAKETSHLVIEHNLNDDIALAAFWVEDFTVDPAAIGQNIPVFDFYVPTNLDVMVTSSSTVNAFKGGATYSYSSGTVSRPGGASTSAYFPGAKDSNTFAFNTSNTAASRIKAGQTLNVLIVAASVFK